MKEYQIMTPMRGVKYMKEIGAVPNSTLPILEIFRAVEGEGIHIGRPKVLVRVGGCAVACTGCDTPHSWTTKSSKLYDACVPNSKLVRDILDECEGYTTHVSVTGGEPLHYPIQMQWLIKQLKNEGLNISMETSGNIRCHDTLKLVDFVSFDIKTPSSGIHLTKENIEYLRQVHLLYDCQIKAIISDMGDLEWLESNFWTLLHSKTVPLILTPAAGPNYTVEKLKDIVDMITEWNKDYSIRMIAQQHVLLSLR